MFESTRAIVVAARSHSRMTVRVGGSTSSFFGLTTKAATVSAQVPVATSSTESTFAATGRPVACPAAVSHLPLDLVAAGHQP